jgi:hypothetical protein
MKPLYALLSAVYACSLPQLLTRDCVVACMKEGFDSGYYAKGKCYCVMAYDYKEIVTRKIWNFPQTALHHDDPPETTEETYNSYPPYRQYPSLWPESKNED